MPTTGDYGKLWATIAGLKSLANISSRVARVVAPKLAQRARNDAALERNPYGKPFAPHKPATVKRWGEHGILHKSGDGISSIDAKPAQGSGITLIADDHMAFSQYGTTTEQIRNVFPNNPTLPKSWSAIIEKESERQIADRLKAAK